MAVAALLASSAFALAAPAPSPASAPCTGTVFTCAALTWDPSLTGTSSLWFANPPTTPTTLAGVEFAMRDAFLSLPPGARSTATGFTVTNASLARLLLNTSSTPGSAAGSTAGAVTITFSDQTQSSTPLVIGSNIRPWETGAADPAVAGVTSPSSTPAWTGLSTRNLSAVIDMLTIPLNGPGAQPVSVVVTNTSTVGAGVSWFGLTFESPRPAPTPPAPPVSAAPVPDPEQAEDAAEQAGEKAQDAAELQPEKVQKAAELERERAYKAAELEREKAYKAAEAREKAHKAGDKAKKPADNQKESDSD